MDILKEASFAKAFLVEAFVTQDTFIVDIIQDRVIRYFDCILMQAFDLLVLEILGYNSEEDIKMANLQLYNWNPFVIIFIYLLEIINNNFESVRTDH